MEYIIINKVELVSGALKRTPLGYVESRSSVDILTGYNDNWQQWTVDNLSGLEDGSKTLTDLFIANPICHEATTTTNYLPEGLTLIATV